MGASAPAKALPFIDRHRPGVRQREVRPVGPHWKEVQGTIRPPSSAVFDGKPVDTGPPGSERGRPAEASASRDLRDQIRRGCRAAAPAPAPRRRPACRSRRVARRTARRAPALAAPLALFAFFAIYRGLRVFLPQPVRLQPDRADGVRRAGELPVPRSDRGPRRGAQLRLLHRRDLLRRLRARAALALALRHKVVGFGWVRLLYFLPVARAGWRSRCVGTGLPPDGPAQPDAAHGRPAG